MLRNRYQRVFRAEAGEDGGDGGSGAGGIDLNDPTIKAAIEQQAKAMAEKNERGLRANRDKLLAELKELKQSVDPEEYQRLRDEHEKREEEKARAAGKFDELRQKLIKQHEDEKSALLQEAGTAKQRLAEYIRKNEAIRAISKVDGIAELLEPHVLSRLRTELREDGTADVVVVDAKGEPRIGEKGEIMTVDQLLAEMKENDVFAPAFRGSRASGGGATGSGAGGRAVSKNPWSKASLNLTEQARILRDNPAQAARLKAEASSAA